MEIDLLTPLELEKFEHLFPPYLLSELPADEILLGCVNEDPLDAAGILMAHPAEAELFVDWIYVDPSYRRKGAGKAMLNVLLDTAAESDAVDAVTLVFSEEQEDLDSFLAACGFAVFMREGDKGFLCSLGAFPKLPVKSALVGALLPLPKVPEKTLQRFSDLLSQSAVPGLAIETPIEAERYLPESCMLLENGTIRGACFVEKNAFGLSIAWIFNNCSVPDMIIHIVNESVGLLQKHYPADTALSFASVNPGVERFVERRVPVQSRAEIYIGTYRFDLED